MNAGDKNNLLERLTETHLAIREALAEANLEFQVYTDSDWRIRDILGHIATWDREATKSLRAFIAGTEYFIQDLDEDLFNQQAVLAQREWPLQQVYREWEQARKDFMDVIRGIPLDQFPGDLLYPWGDERGSINELVEFMIEHDEEHRTEIEKAVKKSA